MLTTATSLFNRYVNGEHEAVWEELSILGSNVRRLQHVDDAISVARETMRRVRVNCQTLILRLETLGWRFGHEWATDVDDDLLAAAPALLGEPLPPPVLDELERRYGVMPLALRAFYDIVGEVNFVGTPLQRPNWPMPIDGLDPLSIASASDITSGRVCLAPDALGKYQLGGVGDTCIQLPDRRVDAPLLFDGSPLYVGGQRMTLVRYLRAALLRGGGFFNFVPGSAWATPPGDDLAFLTRDLLPL